MFHGFRKVTQTRADSERKANHHGLAHVQIKITFTTKIRVDYIRGILPNIFFGIFVLCLISENQENVFLVFWVEHRYRTFQNRVLRGIFGDKEEEGTYKVKIFIICTLHQKLPG
jgi:hypothetical protein